MADIQKRFRELYEYNPSKGIIKENYGDVDTSNYICIGEVPYRPWFNGPNRLYIMVSPQKIMKYGEEQYDVIYTENSDGSGRQIEGIPTYVKRNTVIYPEHQNDEYGEIFLGKRKDDDNVIVVNTYLPTPIWCILDKQTGKWYNKEWKEIEKPFN